MGERRFPESGHKATAMFFVDGENLVARYQSVLGTEPPPSHVSLSRDEYVWSELLGKPPMMAPVNILRKYYYTSIQGDNPKRERIHDDLQKLGVEAPRVFPRSKSRGSKQVDISLSVDMLSHAHRQNYDIAVLIAGDEDYVPLVDAVKAEGHRVFLWFFENGLSPALRRTADHYFNLGQFLLKDRKELLAFGNLIS